MRAIIQRVSCAELSVAGKSVSKISYGMTVYLDGYATWYIVILNSGSMFTSADMAPLSLSAANFAFVPSSVDEKTENEPGCLCHRPTILRGFEYRRETLFAR